MSWGVGTRVNCTCASQPNIIQEKFGKNGHNVVKTVPGTKLNIDCCMTDYCAISLPTPEMPQKYLELS